MVFLPLTLCGHGTSTRYWHPQPDQMIERASSYACGKLWWGGQGGHKGLKRRLKGSSRKCQSSRVLSFGSRKYAMKFHANVRGEVWVNFLGLLCIFMYGASKLLIIESPQIVDTRKPSECRQTHRQSEHSRRRADYGF